MRKLTSVDGLMALLTLVLFVLLTEALSQTPLTRFNSWIQLLKKKKKKKTIIIIHAHAVNSVFGTLDDPQKHFFSDSLCILL